MNLTINQALQKGVTAHRAGELQVAEKLYSAIIDAQPQHPDANHNMGVLAVGVGKVEDALPYFKTALESKPSEAQFWLSYIDALIKLRKFSEAKALFFQAKGMGASGEGFDDLETKLLEESGTLKAQTPADSEASRTQSSILDSLTLDQAIKMARGKAKEGRTEEASILYQDILTKFPHNKKAKTELKLLSNSANVEKAKALEPPKSDLQQLMNFYNQGQLQSALESAQELLKRYPNSIFLHNVSGVSLAGLKQFGAAIESFQQTIRIDPDCAEAYNNKGNAQKELGQLGAAIESFRQAIRIKPDFAEAYNNQGNVLKDQGEKRAAIECYQTAIKINPEYSGAYNNRGNVQKELGQLGAAIESFQQAIKIKSDFAEAYYSMGAALEGVVFNKPNPDLQAIIVSILDHKTIARPRDISIAAISLLKFEPAVIETLQDFSKGILDHSFQERILSLSKLPLLLNLMSCCPLADLELESVLTAIRCYLLTKIIEKNLNSNLLQFQSALALQSFCNEYIYSQSDAETRLVAELEILLEEQLVNGEQPSPQSILCLASYKGLNEYGWCDLVTVSSDIEEVFTRQVIEPKREVQLKPDIPVLREITDKVSSKVRLQYEENPYPRWVNLGIPLNSLWISELVAQVKLKLFDLRINENESPNILIAGCGTGQHCIRTAKRFKNSRILAIDLSLSSLAYAKRKSDELRINNIEYLQADILDIGKLERQFDIIESAGVLHHMDDPMAGWKVLTDCLKPGGLMKIALYSELARKQIVEMREEISRTGIGSTSSAMKSFRSELISSSNKRYKLIFGSPDFYSLSTLRDLLFHVQEHRFTIPQIKNCLSRLGLNFCGFESSGIVPNFSRKNSGTDDLYDLDKWHSFEEDNPSLFGQMYQFWCQKEAES